MPSSRRFTRPQGKKLTGVAKKHPRPVGPARAKSDGRGGSSAHGPRVPRRILVADADTEAVAGTAFALAAAAYRVTTVLSADEALQALRRERYDLIVLSATLGASSGIDVLRTLRSLARPDVFGTQTESVGVVMILDGREEDLDAEGYRALAHGADDVLARPFSSRELLFRMAAILRRAANTPASSRDVVRLGELYVDLAGHNVMVEDEIVDLTRGEFALLRVLIENAGRLCTRARLSGSSDDAKRIPSRTIDMQISRLRKKLGSAGRMVVNVRGEGYRLERVRPRLRP